jgi:hypothetical protein
MPIKQKMSKKRKESSETKSARRTKTSLTTKNNWLFKRKLMLIDKYLKLNLIMNTKIKVYHFKESCLTTHQSGWDTQLS